MLRGQLARIGIALALLLLILSLFVSSPTARFALSVLMALAALLPVVCGPNRFRMVGIMAVVAGLAIAYPLYPAFRGDPYYVRGRVSQAVAFGVRVAQAADRLAAEKNRPPKSLRELDMDLPRGIVQDVSFPKDGAVLVILEVPTLYGAVLQFTPTGSPGAREWRCTAQAIPNALLPSPCRGNPPAAP